jgi:hypothetical protein
MPSNPHWSLEVFSKLSFLFCFIFFWVREKIHTRSGLSAPRKNLKIFLIKDIVTRSLAGRFLNFL